MYPSTRSTMANCIFEWLSAVDYSKMYAVTLTMQQNNNGLSLDRMIASQNLRHFLNVCNQKIFGNSFRRYGLKLKVLPFIELSAWQRLHYHLSIEKPDRISEDKFFEIVETSWLRTNFGRKEIDIRKIYSNGWLSYCIKSKDPAHAIDYENLNLN